MMQLAIRLARRQIGQTWPNPAVGCVVVKDGQILATGATAHSGRPHAETIALTAAGAHAKGATLYVSLEPCAHTGQTPPCAQAIIQAGIARVVIGCGDPDTRVNGQGIAQLHAAGIIVESGVCEAGAAQVNEGFLTRIRTDKPFVAMKLATSLDGKIATATGHSQWITNEHARAYGQRIRANYDAILTGIGTVKADNPQLTCRLNGMEHHSPIRVVLDTQLQLSPDSALAMTAKTTPTWVITSDTQKNSAARATLEKLGVRCFFTPEKHGRVDVPAALTMLGEEGLTRVLVEAGNQVSTAMLHEQVVRKIYWFRGHQVIGDDGLPALGELGLEKLGDAAAWQLESQRMIENNTLSVYRHIT